MTPSDQTPQEGRRDDDWIEVSDWIPEGMTDPVEWVAYFLNERDEAMPHCVSDDGTERAQSAQIILKCLKTLGFSQ